MPKAINDPLLLIGKIFAIILQVGMAIGAVALIIAIPTIIIAGGYVEAEIAKEAPSIDEPFPAIWIAAIMAIGLSIVAMLFVFFGKLRRIIGTVGEGDPFQPENARRLSLMAWLMLGTQLVMIPGAAIAIPLSRYADEVKKSGIEDVSFSFDGSGMDMTAWLLVVILFILARVFRHGAAMRDDLEGTV
ncbi:DUF2975 domain-containing protein [Citromicrobium bathyomarinum]|uniref:DUF2975 domain-containing protein n=1 Tax=Citromicrobium bathyomarinum TaxID=72174 RepID=UPI00315A6411